MLIGFDHGIRIIVLQREDGGDGGRTFITQKSNLYCQQPTLSGTIASTLKGK